MNTKTPTLLLGLTALLFTVLLPAAPMYLPVVSTTLETPAFGETPPCKVSIQLTPDFKHIAKATLQIGEDKFDFPADALSGIEFPDLTSMRIEVENGMDGRFWVSIVLQPARHTEHPTRYHITVIDGKFARVSRTWDEPHGTSIARRSEILHKVEETTPDD